MSSVVTQMERGKCNKLFRLVLPLIFRKRVFKNNTPCMQRFSFDGSRNKVWRGTVLKKRSKICKCMRGKGLDSELIPAQMGWLRSTSGSWSHSQSAFGSVSDRRQPEWNANFDKLFRLETIIFKIIRGILNWPKIISVPFVYYFPPMYQDDLHLFHFFDISFL